MFFEVRQTKNALAAVTRINDDGSHNRIAVCTKFTEAKALVNFINDLLRINVQVQEILKDKK